MPIDNIIAGENVTVARAGRVVTITATGGEGGPHTHPTSDVTGLDDALAAHDAAIGDLEAAVETKSTIGHGHALDEVSGLAEALAAKQAASEKGQANGYAGLGADGKVPAAQLPAAGGATAREDLVAQWDVSSTKTNIGTAFVNVYVQANGDGKSVQIDTTGKTHVRLYVLWNKVGSGTHTVQVLEAGTANVLISMTVVSGRNVSALVAIPAGLADAVKNYVLQAKSTTAADDPIFEGARVYLK